MDPGKGSCPGAHDGAGTKQAGLAQKQSGTSPDGQDYEHADIVVENVSIGEVSSSDVGTGEEEITRVLQQTPRPVQAEPRVL